MKVAAADAHCRRSPAWSPVDSAQDVPERDSASVRCVLFLSLSLESGAVTIMRETRSSSDRLLARALSPARIRAHVGTTGAWPAEG